MLLFAFLCIALGVYPAPLYALLPYTVDYVPYTASHVIAQLQLLLFSGLAFFVMLPWLKRTRTITLDADWSYRRAGASIARVTVGVTSRAYSAAAGATGAVLRQALARVYRHHGPAGVLSRTWPTGSMVLWVAILLASYLVLYYL
jgi:multicomponent Na+:H+ antiporter subunit D